MPCGSVGELDLSWSTHHWNLSTGSLDNRICTKLWLPPITYDHTHRRTRDPVRSPIDKPMRAGLVVGSVTTSEYLVLYVFLAFFILFYFLFLIFFIFLGKESFSQPKKIKGSLDGAEFCSLTLYYSIRLVKLARPPPCRLS